MALKWAREGEICGYHSLWVPKNPEGPQNSSLTVRSFVFFFLKSHKRQEYRTRLISSRSRHVATNGRMIFFPMVECYFLVCIYMTGFPDGASGKELTCQCRQMQTEETWVQSPIQEDSLEEGMATHSSILARRIPRTEKPGGLWCMGSQTVRHDWAT